MIEVIIKHDLWRDLHVGEEIKPGDRYCGAHDEWYILQLENIKRSLVVGDYSYPFQRKVN